MSANPILRCVLALTLAGAACLSTGAGAAGGGDVRLLSAKVDLDDRPSLQRGAKLFVNYCLSCHSAAFMRYNRMGRDLGLSDEQVEQNLMFASDKVGNTMTVAMRPEDGESWFGVAPPDLSVISRARGPDWLYTYLMTFYRDASRPTGVNNLAFPEVSMPHVLGQLQGTQVLREHGDGEGTAHQGPRSVNDLLELETAGSLNAAEYRTVARDLTNFLVYMGEPAMLKRYTVGFWVLVFLAVFYVLSRALYKEYWRDVS